MSAQDDPLLEYRRRFPILSRANYLISNSLGAMPAAVESSLAEYAHVWANRGVRAWEETWWTMAADLGDLVAALIGAGAGEVVFQPSVTLAHGVVFSAFEFGGDRKTIVTDALHFPSVLYLIEEQKRRGADVEIVPSDDGLTIDVERTIASIDERICIVCISHVLFKSAFIQDIDAICERARKVGAITIVDGYQSVGTIPVDVKRSRVDIFIGGCLKWLCGGPGAAFLWVNPELRSRLSPALTGWMSHVRPFGFEPFLERREDAWRFLHGTPSIASLYAAKPGLEIIAEVGIDAIRSKSIRQSSRLIELAEARGFACASPRDPRQRGGTVAVNIEHGYEVSKALKAREILCDFRPGVGVRLSPHFYTRDEELAEAIDAIADILKTKAWQSFAGSRSSVT